MVCFVLGSNLYTGKKMKIITYTGYVYQASVNLLNNLNGFNLLICKKYNAAFHSSWLSIRVYYFDKISKYIQYLQKVSIINLY